MTREPKQQQEEEKNAKKKAALQISNFLFMIGG